MAIHVIFIESEENVSTTRENSPKSGNRISQVFAYVIVGSIGFYQVPVVHTGLFQKEAGVFRHCEFLGQIFPII